MSDESILQEADRLIHGDRRSSYGPASKDFQTTADFWSLYLKNRGKLAENLEPKDVAVMMALLKIRREMFQPKRDNLTDACGYLALAYDIEAERPGT